MRQHNPSPTESPCFLRSIPSRLQEVVNAMAGVPLVVQASRWLGLPGSVRQHLAIKERRRGYDEAMYVESFVILNAVGGECLDDFQSLREDPGLSELVGHDLPPPEAARNFLYQFHEQSKSEEAKQRRGRDEIAYIPEESEILQGWLESIGTWCSDWGGVARNSASPPWIRRPRSLRATRGSAADV